MKSIQLIGVVAAFLVTSGVCAQEKTKAVKAQTVQMQQTKAPEPKTNEKKLEVPTQPAAPAPASSAPAQSEAQPSGSTTPQQKIKPPRTGRLKARTRTVKQNVGGGNQ